MPWQSGGARGVSREPAGKDGPAPAAPCPGTEAAPRLSPQLPLRLEAACFHFWVPPVSSWMKHPCLGAGCSQRSETWPSLSRRAYISIPAALSDAKLFLTLPNCPVTFGNSRAWQPTISSQTAELTAAPNLCQRSCSSCLIWLQKNELAWLTGSVSPADSRPSDGREGKGRGKAEPEQPGSPACSAARWLSQLQAGRSAFPCFSSLDNVPRSSTEGIPQSEMRGLLLNVLCSDFRKEPALLQHPQFQCCP